MENHKFTLGYRIEEAKSLGFVWIGEYPIAYDGVFKNNVKVVMASPVGYLLVMDTYRWESQKNKFVKDLGLNKCELIFTATQKVDYLTLSYSQRSYTGDGYSTFHNDVHGELKDRLSDIEHELSVCKNINDRLSFFSLIYPQVNCPTHQEENYSDKRDKFLLETIKDYPDWVKHMLGFENHPDAVRPKVWAEIKPLQRVSLKKTMKARSNARSKFIVIPVGQQWDKLHIHGHITTFNGLTILGWSPVNSYLMLYEPATSLKVVKKEEGEEPEIFNCYLNFDLKNQVIKSPVEGFVSNKRDLSQLIDAATYGGGWNGRPRYRFTDTRSLIRAFIFKQLHNKLLVTESFDVDKCHRFLKERFTHTPATDLHGLEAKIDWKRLKKSFKQNFNRFKLNNKEWEKHQQKMNELNEES